MSENITVLVVDDHEVFAEGLRLLIDAAPDLESVGMAPTAAAGLKLAAECRPDVILLDHHLPDRTGAAATADFKQRLPDTAVVILTSDASEQPLLAAFEAGATGYLLKTKAARQVLQAIRQAAAGETLINAATLGRVLRYRDDLERVAQERPHLSERELQVLRAMADGLDTLAICKQLGVTNSTTRTYVQSILRKLDAHSRLQAVVRANRYGLLKPG
jgi:DNA-binding NarL/FixJ family response regulator